MPDGIGEVDQAPRAVATREERPAEPDPGFPGPKPAFPAPKSLADVNFDDLLPPEPEPEEPSSSFSAPRPISEAFDDVPRFPTQAQAQAAREKPGSAFPAPPMPESSFDEPQTLPDPSASPNPAPAPAFPAPPAMADVSFDDPRPTPPAPSPAPGFPAPPVATASGMGISISGAPVPHAPQQTPAQIAANSQSLRIRLLRPDGKPFDGPEITTGPKEPEAAGGQARSGFDAAQRGPKKQAPKVVVKAGPLERLGHTLAVLVISAVGIVPLGYLMLQSVHDREDKLAERITVPTKMNVLDGTSEAYLGGMAAVLLVVALVYWMRLKRRRER